MINFGVREVANSRATAAPGWAYVPDTGANASVTALQPSSRTRVRNQPTASLHETTAKQEAKILRELAALDRENHRDVSIPVPIRHKDSAGRGMNLLWLSTSNITDNYHQQSAMARVPPLFARSFNPRRLSQTTCLTSKLYRHSPQPLSLSFRHQRRQLCVPHQTQ